MTAAVNAPYVGSDGPVCGVATCTRLPDPVLCRKHSDDLGQMLAAIGTEFDALDARPSMAAREPDTGGSGTLASQKAPARLDVLGLRDNRMAADQPDADHDGVLPVLAWWANGVRDQRGLAAAMTAYQLPGSQTIHVQWPAHLTVATERKFLAAHLPWILEQPAAGAFHDQIRRLWARLRAANGHAADRRAIRCRRDTDGGECGGGVRIADGTATCGRCGHTTTGLALLRQGAAA